MEKKLYKPYCTDYNSLRVQDLWQAHYLAEGVHKTKCKYEHNDKKCETYGIKYKYCDCFLEYTNFKDDLIEYKRFCYNKNYQKEFLEKFLEKE